MSRALSALSIYRVHFGLQSGTGRSMTKLQSHSSSLFKVTLQIHSVNGSSIIGSLFNNSLQSATDRSIHYINSSLLLIFTTTALQSQLQTTIRNMSLTLQKVSTSQETFHSLTTLYFTLQSGTGRSSTHHYNVTSLLQLCDHALPL